MGTLSNLHDLSRRSTFKVRQTLYLFLQCKSLDNLKKLVPRSFENLIGAFFYKTTIPSSTPTPIRHLELPIAPSSNLLSPVQFSSGNITSLDQMRQYRPKRAISKSPTWEKRRLSLISKPITISNCLFIYSIVL